MIQLLNENAPKNEVLIFQTTILEKSAKYSRLQNCPIFGTCNSIEKYRYLRV